MSDHVKIYPLAKAMHDLNDAEISCWYVLNHINGSAHNKAQNTVDQFNRANNSNLELFAPTYVVREEKSGELHFRTASLTFHYVFVKGPFETVKKLCGQTNGFSFLIDRSNERRYATIDDRRMTHFRNIARAYKNCLPYFSLEDIDLEDGDLVEVIKGDMPGLIGHYMPNPRSKTGNIVLHVFNKVGTIAFNVKASDVRVLEFSRNSTRANDQIDAFVPHLFKALRNYHQGEILSKPLAAKLNLFCGRMEVAHLSNRKLDARLQILLHAANLIIGNQPAARHALDRFNKLKDAVTNVWTSATNALILSLLRNDIDTLKAEYQKIAALAPASKAQQSIKEEFEYYLHAL
ncbi:MAG: hypothetical protein HDS12_00815 [Bacteroides sp.]|nr:hypothetical protein [Bacteroides sp.]